MRALASSCIAIGGLGFCNSDVIFCMWHHLSMAVSVPQLLFWIVALFSSNSMFVTRASWNWAENGPRTVHKEVEHPLCDCIRRAQFSKQVNDYGLWWLRNDEVISLRCYFSILVARFSVEMYAYLSAKNHKPNYRGAARCRPRTTLTRLTTPWRVKRRE